jgi:hypothetical protein
MIIDKHFLMSSRYLSVLDDNEENIPYVSSVNTITGEINQLRFDNCKPIIINNEIATKKIFVNKPVKLVYKEKYNLIFTTIEHIKLITERFQTHEYICWHSIPDIINPFIHVSNFITVTEEEYPYLKKNKKYYSRIADVYVAESNDNQFAMIMIDIDNVLTSPSPDVDMFGYTL